MFIIGWQCKETSKLFLQYINTICWIEKLIFDFYEMPNCLCAIEEEEEESNPIQLMLSNKTIDIICDKERRSILLLWDQSKKMKWIQILIFCYFIPSEKDFWRNFGLFPEKGISVEFSMKKIILHFSGNFPEKINPIKLDLDPDQFNVCIMFTISKT